MGVKKTPIREDEKGTVERLRRHEVIAAAQGVVPSDEMMNRVVGNLQHGFMSAALLSEQERQFFYAMIERYEADYVLNSSADWMQTELICLLFLQGLRAMELKDWESFARIDGSLRSHLREMKASKRGREGEENKTPQQSPAEWASALVEKVARLRAEADDEARARGGSTRVAGELACRDSAE